MTGLRFGSVVVLSPVDSDSSGRQRWWVECDCGNRTTSRGDSLRRGDVKSCNRGGCTGSAKIKGEGHPLRREATYESMHQRLRRERGYASSHPCIDCGEQARDWSYDKSDPNEKRNGEGHPFSDKQEHYVARCRPCHNRFDSPLEVVR